MEVTNPNSSLPLSETTLYIILSLAPGPKHGYAIAREVQALSQDRVILSVSTLYTTLKRLLGDGWIERVGDVPEHDESGRPRKVYALTELGRRNLATERVRLKMLLAVIQEQTVGEEL